MTIPNIRSEDYTYDLPEHRIAAYPLAERDASKLLIADLRTGRCAIQHSVFRNIPEHLPSETLLVVNNSRVIAARILMQKLSGGKAEILCLRPNPLAGKNAEYANAMQAQGHSEWLCMVGGRKISAGDVLSTTFTIQTPSNNGITTTETVTLEAHIVRKAGSEAEVDFKWQPQHITFAECLEVCGHIPLPPYIKRDDEASDKERYQTVYAAHNGSVAAPTAGLHFTEKVLSALRNKGIREESVTLHVGAGTFKPMTSENAAEHVMHEERIFVEQRMITALANQLKIHEEHSTHPVVAVGTTSMRTLESLYWWAVRVISDDISLNETEVNIRQWDDLRLQEVCAQKGIAMPSAHQALERLLVWMQEHRIETLSGETQIMIAPGYTFRICTGLITNFHQPQSTLMLLVAAFLQDSDSPTEHWRSVYAEALANEYRFLSYGDSSLLWRK